MSAQSASITSEQDALTKGSTEAQLWLDKINERLDAEKDWRQAARLAIAAYEAKKQVPGTTHAKPMFAIFHSNINTLAPAVYNQTPVPDVRRRYGDKDAVARLGATIAERALTAALDGYEFDHVMKRAVRNAILAGRGVTRLRYEPKFGIETDPDGSQFETIKHEAVITEPVRWDRYTHGDAETWALRPWEAFHHDLSKDEVWTLIKPDEPQIPPAPIAPDMPEMTGDPFEDERVFTEHEQQTAQFATEQQAHIQAIALAQKEHEERLTEAKQRLETFAFGAKTIDGSDRDKPTPAKGVLMTVPCWEVWDKASRKVIWVCEKDTRLVLKVFDDPLELSGFFSTPRPLMQTEGESSLIPVCPHDVYADLIAEIDDTTKRIKATIEDMRVRGLADPKMQKDLELLAAAQDGEMVSSNLPENFVSGASKTIQDLVMWWPVDQDVNVLKALMEHREAIKQIIYEVTGLSDILRGSTNAGETATAQQIKATWGSQRVQELQAEVQRYAKDLFKMKAEVVFGKFQDETIRQMCLLPEPINPDEIAAGVPPPEPPQPQLDEAGQPVQGQQHDQQAMQAQHQQMVEQAIAQAEEAAEQQFQAALTMMRDKLSFFRVDIETDSTVRPDLGREQENMSQFLQSTATFGQAMATVAQVLPAIVPQLTKVYTAMVRRTMKLGKSIEDVLDELEKASQQPPTPQGQSSDPRAEAEAMQAQDQMADRQHSRDMEMEQAKGQNIERKNAAIGMKAQADEANFGRQMFMRQVTPAMPPKGGNPPRYEGDAA